MINAPRILAGIWNCAGARIDVGHLDTFQQVL
jgi:hypothetical protein